MLWFIYMIKVCKLWQPNHKWGYVAALYIWHNIQKDEQEVRRSKVGKGFTNPQQKHTGKSFSKQIIS